MRKVVSLDWLRQCGEEQADDTQDPLEMLISAEDRKDNIRNISGILNVEQWGLLNAIKLHNGNIREASHALGISHMTGYRRTQKIREMMLQNRQS